MYEYARSPGAENFRICRDQAHPQPPGPGQSTLAPLSGVNVQSGAAQGCSKRSVPCNLINTLSLPVAETDTGALDLPVIATVRGPSYNGCRRGARAGEHLVAGESHRHTIEPWNDYAILEKLLVQHLVRMLGTGPGTSGARAFEHSELTIDLLGDGDDPVLLQLQLKDR